MDKRFSISNWFPEYPNNKTLKQVQGDENLENDPN
jgi:hypothetical protein